MINILCTTKCSVTFIKVLTILLFPTCALSQVTQTPSTGFDPFTEKVLVAIVTAILTLIVGYILFQLKERREPRKRLSYDLKTRHGLVAIEESIARYISLTYKGRSADKLTYVRCDIKNTGNTVIKAEFLRFEFSEGSQILDAYTEPLPPREYGVSEIAEPSLKPHERRYQIQHLEKQQQVGFRFVLSDTPEPEPRIVPFNEDGDVEVTAASISRAADDRQRIEHFIYLFVLSLIISQVFSLLPAFLGIALSFMYGILGIAMLMLLKPFSRAVAMAIVNFGRPQQPEISISQLKQEKGASLSIAAGHGYAHVSSNPE